MGNIGDNYKLAIQGVKATLLDDIFREQGMTAILAKQMSSYTEEQQKLLNELIVKQAGLIEKMLTFVDDLDELMKNLFDIGQEIRTITKGGNDVVVNVNGEKTIGEISDIVTQVSHGELTIPGAVDTVVAATSVPGDVTSSGNTAPASATGELTMPGAVDTVVAATSVPGDVTSLENTAISSATGELTIPGAVDTVVAATSVPGDVTSSENTATASATGELTIPGAVDTVVATTSVPGDVTSSGNTAIASATGELTIPGAVDTAVAATSVPGDVTSSENTATASATGEEKGPETETTTVVAIAPPVENPSVEAVQGQTASGKKIDVVNPPINETVTLASSTNALEEDIVSASDTSTIVPFALSPIDEGVTPAADTTIAEGSEQTMPVADGSAVVATIIPEVSVATTDAKVDDKKKEMEDLLNQATALYQQGKTEEAQALYNQISLMNQGIQAVQPSADTSLSLTTTEVPSNVIRFTRIVNGQPKAILVTKSQKEKLVASRETNRVIAFPNGFAAEAKVLVKAA